MQDCTLKTQKSLFSKSLEELAREGARKMIEIALEAEITDFIDSFKAIRDESGRRQLIRNGYHPRRKIVTGIGEIDVRVPRSRDHREGFSDAICYHSKIIPPYLRRSKDLDEFIPFLYLKGISTGDFSEVLSQLVGKDVSLSAGTVVRLKEQWEEEYNRWSGRDLSDKRYVYWWVDGVYFNIRLEEERSCMLIIMGATEDGKKELVAVEDGYRESSISWNNILLNLKSRGLKRGPKLATGDGSLGFWNALSKEFPETRHQRCWVHRTANVLDKMPKSVQKQAKRQIHDIYLAPSKEEALKAFDKFVKLYDAKFPKATQCLLKTKKETLAFYDFPAEHWRHIRSTNPIESTFATVRLRTHKTKGCGSRIASLTMVFKLIQAAEKRWQRLHSSNLIQLVLNGVKFIDGVQHAA
ncbi:IS256 family transposase [bacterium]|nr:IS256 family transposase [bacterium]